MDIYVLASIVVALALVAFFVLRRKKPTQSSNESLPEAQRQAPVESGKSQPARVAGSPQTSQHGVRGHHPGPDSKQSPDARAQSASSGSRPGDTESPANDDSIDLESALEASEPLDEPGSPPPPPHRVGGGTAAVVGRKAELQSLRKGLAKSRQAEGFFGRLKGLLGGRKDIDPRIAEEIEEVLLTSDVGVRTTEAILERIKDSLDRGALKSEADVWGALREEARRILSVDGRSGGIALSSSPTVVLMVGVNGAGKTTTVGKLAAQFSDAGKKVMLAAGDTFRAAAVDQLKAWGERVGCEVITGRDGADPSSVLFDAITAAKDAGADVLLADTAGRLHTKTNLMQEMAKIEKTAAKALSGAPHEVLLVIDATNGQNAMAQAKEFQQSLNVTGLILTKLDGTARGGAVLGICDTLQLPVRYIGVGERTEDLYEFDIYAFVEALLGGENEEIAA